MNIFCWLGLMILMFTPAPLVYAQAGAEASVQVGQQQKPGTSTTETVQKSKDGSTEVKTTSSKLDHAAYKYSGLPGKWTGGVANTGSSAPLAKDTGPNPRYTVDRLPVGANPEEALWVKMGDGRMMMVDPKIVQALH